jgi:hypothetical protein
VVTILTASLFVPIDQAAERSHYVAGQLPSVIHKNDVVWLILAYSNLNPNLNPHEVNLLYLAARLDG